MEIAAAQRDISNAYVGGAPGVFISGIAWLIAALMNTRYGAKEAFAALSIAGMLIVPASLLIGKLMFDTGKVPPDNPLERLGFEASVVLFAGILICFVLLQVAPELALPALAIAIGARYFSFRTIYGEPIYWVLGGVLASVGAVAMIRPTLLPLGPLLIVGVAECAFAALLLVRWNRRRKRSASEMQR